MSVLYPRLLDRTARELHDRYRSMPVTELRELRAFGHPSAVFAATGGRRVPVGHLEDLRERIIGIATAAGYPARANRGAHTAFDREVAQLLHERCGLVAAEAAVRPIWAFLALVVLPDVSYWRYPDPPAERVLATDITRHVWGRLWWRAHLLVLPETFADRYRLLSAFGEADFDQIYARRAMLGGSRRLVRAVAETWPTIDRGGLQSREVLRDLLKRLLRVAPLLDFDVLDDLELHEQIRWEARNAVLELRRAGLGSAPDA